MKSPAEFNDHLLRLGFDFFTGVPCSLAKGVLADLCERELFVVENREDAALGLAAGAFLGGRWPVVIMQSSGLGVSMNALSSLHLIYRIPTLLLITWRGYGGRDAPEHVIWGPALTAALDCIDVPHQELRSEAIGAQLEWADRSLRETSAPVALLCPPGVLP
jgi:phosphonopyruvate decarboxylase